MSRDRSPIFIEHLAGRPFRAGLARGPTLLHSSSLESIPGSVDPCHQQAKTLAGSAAKPTDLSRRQVIAAAVALCASMSARRAKGAEPETRYDFTRPLDGWETVSGTWVIEDVPGASEGGKALVQRATDKAFDVIVAPGGPYANVAVDVRFKPISGREDASGGIVFRFSEGRYYVIRANALENNFNFYYYEPKSPRASGGGGRHSITGVSIKAPALGQWHRMRVSAEGDHIKGWLNDLLLIDHHDSRIGSGKVGLWTKADSVTAFDSLVVRPF
jgi:3-keto-disaccharide hydrolase